MNQSAPTALEPTSPFKGTFRLFLLGSLITLGCIYWLRLSFGPLHRGEIDPLYVTNFLLTYVFLFVCYWFFVMPLLKGKRMDPRHLWFAIAFGLLFRAVLLPSDLILEDDIYRYLWDGHVTLQGENPYRYAPSSGHTEPYRTDYWNKINYPYVPTLYPPTLQYLFAAVQIIYPGSVVGLKLVLVFFDIGTIFLLLTVLERLKLPQEWCLLYAWSPLVLKEIANSGHTDAVSAFLLVAWMSLMVQRRYAWSAVVMALLTLTKFFGVFLLPLLHNRWRWRDYGLCLALMVVLYVPFLSFEFNVFAGFATYSQEWRFNAGIYDWLEGLLSRGSEKMAENSGFLARLIMFGVISLFVFWQSARMVWHSDDRNLFRGCFIVLAALLLCSPVIDPWYLVWIVPFLCFFPNRAWILFTGLIFLSYVFYFEYDFPAWVPPVEFGIFFFYLFLEFLIPSLRLSRPVSQAQVSQPEAGQI